jgi:quercetin dioxygenase-like cupin family protein
MMKKGHRCSLQFHKKKHETIYVLRGSLKIYFGKNKKRLKKKVLKKDGTIIIEPGTIHRMEAVNNAIYLEASTPQLKDVIRLSDDYKRV